MGTTELFFTTFSILVIEVIVFGAMQGTINPDYNFLDSTTLLHIDPPKAPDMNKDNPLSFLTDTPAAISYGVAVLIYWISFPINVIAFPFMVATQAALFIGKYPYLVAFNAVLVILLAYSILSRIMGGN